MNAAVKFLDFRRSAGAENPQDELVVVTGGLTLGASRMSGSDKQTYYKMGTSPSVPDTAADFAATLTAFGCCHGDTALAEGVGSLRGFYNLVEAGVPFPHDPSGAFIGYKTDHDPAERATSAGPKTSKFMSQCLQDIVERAGVRIIDKHPVLRFVTEGAGDDKQIVAMICLDLSDPQAGISLTVFLADNWILAGGGPGEIYQTTVYPRGQIGMHAPALQAGLKACNLTESQYGLASIKFRWNVSGTYMQVIPRIFSTDAEGGDPREFLTEYFDDMQTMATNIFLKGYQWPFDAQRITDHQSSLIDMAVHQETVVRGRRVWMDFLQNPLGAEGWDEFDLGSLGAEASDYLIKTGASQPLPIERLAHMNTPAIELYAEHEIDLHSEPLEIAVCAQHMNGGFAVDHWWTSNIPNVFVIGEMAGTHGVKRPGGSALNAGQVGALRAAEYIAMARPHDQAGDEGPGFIVTDALDETIAKINNMLETSESATRTPGDIMDEIRVRMTRCGAHLRSRQGADDALKAAIDQYKRLKEEGMKLTGPGQIHRAIAAQQQCLTHIAMLKAICAMFQREGGSRGSHCILDDGGAEMHPRLIDPETDKPYRFKPENESLRNEIIEISFNPLSEDLFDADVVPVRPTPVNETAFEPAWAKFRNGEIYDKGSSNGD